MEEANRQRQHVQAVAVQQRRQPSPSPPGARLRHVASKVLEDDRVSTRGEHEELRQRHWALADCSSTLSRLAHDQATNV